MSTKHSLYNMQFFTEVLEGIVQLLGAIKSISLKTEFKEGVLRRWSQQLNFNKWSIFVLSIRVNFFSLNPVYTTKGQVVSDDFTFCLRARLIEELEAIHIWK